MPKSTAPSNSGNDNRYRMSRRMSAIAFNGYEVRVVNNTFADFGTPEERSLDIHARWKSAS